MKQADGLKVTFHKRRHRRSKAEMETGRSKMMLAVLSIVFIFGIFLSLTG